jgi:hypothetical protein
MLRGGAVDFPKRGEYINGGHPMDVNPPGARTLPGPVGSQQAAVPRPGLSRAPGSRSPGRLIYLYFPGEN